MNETNDSVILFAHPTKSLGCFTIETRRAALVAVVLGPCEPNAREYTLRNDLFPGFEAHFATPYDAIKAVAGHRTGLPDWDGSEEGASDYAGHWERQIDKRLQKEMLTTYLARVPNGCMRAVVDYFEVRHFYYLERHALRKLFIAMVKAGEITEIPSMRLAPAEMSDLTRLAKKYLNRESPK